jgi:hypothetical protein
MPSTYPLDATYSSATMVDKLPDRGFSEERRFDAIIFESQAGYEARRQRSRRAKRRYSLQYTNISGNYKRAIVDFYNARGGDFEAFFFNLAHLTSSGTVTVRFDGPLQVVQTGALSDTDDSRNYYTVSFTLQEVFI